MFRNSFLKQKSVKYYEPVVEYISSFENDIWNIEVNSFSEDNINTIILIKI